MIWLGKWTEACDPFPLSLRVSPREILILKGTNKAFKNAFKFASLGRHSGLYKANFTNYCDVQISTNIHFKANQVVSFLKVYVENALAHVQLYFACEMALIRG